jgi:hypothetical protein
VRPRVWWRRVSREEFARVVRWVEDGSWWVLQLVAGGSELPDGTVVGLDLPASAVVLAPAEEVEAYERACYDLLASMGGEVVEVDDEGRETVVAEPPGVAPDEAARRLWRYALNGDASMVRRLTGRPISDRAVAVFCGFATPVVLGKAPLTDEWWATLERRASSNSPASVLYASLRLAYEAGGLGRNIGHRKRVAIADRCIVCGRVYEPRGRARTCGHPDCRKELARRRYRRWYLLHRQASGRAR